jgi:hypothetical protein
MSIILPFLGNLPFMGKFCPLGHSAGFQARLNLPSGNKERAGYQPESQANALNRPGRICRPGRAALPSGPGGVWCGRATAPSASAPGYGVPLPGSGGMLKSLPTWIATQAIGSRTPASPRSGGSPSPYRGRADVCKTSFLGWNVWKGAVAHAIPRACCRIMSKTVRVNV